VSRVNPQGLLRGRPLNIGRKKLAEVPSLSFFKIQVPSVIRIETEIPKNKIFKPQIPNISLTLKIESLYFILSCVLIRLTKIIQLTVGLANSMPIYMGYADELS
jgi:hypothetical protein